jgi:hypothetical protein
VEDDERGAFDGAFLTTCFTAVGCPALRLLHAQAIFILGILDINSKKIIKRKKTKEMKKFFMILAIAALALVSYSCGCNKEKNVEVIEETVECAQAVDSVAVDSLVVE